MELKTIDGWHKSGCGDWDTYCKPGELVDEGVADYFLDILPPRTMKKGYFQVGEPHSHAVNPETMQSCGTYATFVRVGGGMWEYKGHCFPNGLTEAERYVKYDGLKDFFQKTYKLMAGIVQIPRPHIFCKDGFKMTEQEKSDREQLEYLKRWQEQKQRKRKKDNVFSKILRREKKNGRNRKKGGH